MLKENGTLMILDDDRITFYNPVFDTTLENLDDYVPWPCNFNKRALTKDLVQLPAESKLFPGWNCGRQFEPRYKYFEELQELVCGIAASNGSTIPPLIVTKPAGAGAANTLANSFATVGPSASGPSTAEVSAAGALVSGALTLAVGGPTILGLLPPISTILQPSVKQAPLSTPKPMVACTDTQTDPVHAVSPAFKLVSCPTSTTISATVQPSSSSGVAGPSRQSSNISDGAQPILSSPLLTLAAIRNALGADPLARLTNANL